ncbi:MAG: PH domain-containing protein [Rothia sp. (in: high G+C Gram-positive bacteria)]|nr:PH domain-containing protein [Rothia sp. (in: high G+C Gram-positive bacteria)]
MKLRGSLYAQEKVIVATRSHESFLLPAAGYGFITMLALSFASTIYNSSQLFGILGYLFSAWFFWLCLRRLVRWLATSFIITNQRLVIQTGLGRAASVSIPLETIEGITAKDSLLALGGSARLMVHSRGAIHELRQIPRGQQFSLEVRKAQSQFFADRATFSRNRGYGF